MKILTSIAKRRLSRSYDCTKKDTDDLALDFESLHIPTYCPIFGTELIYTHSTLDKEAIPAFIAINPSIGLRKGNIAIVSLKAKLKHLYYKKNPYKRT